MAEAGDLTDKQRLFAAEYLSCLNGTEAAARAGYQGDRNVLGVTAYDNLRNPKIRELIEAGFAERTMSRSEVLTRLSDHATGSMDDFLTINGRGVRLDIAKGLKAGKGHLVKKYTRTDKGVSIELYDAQAALVQIGRHHGLFVDKTALTDPTGTKEYADSTLDALRERLITQLTTSSSSAGAGGVHPEPDTTGDDEAAV